MPPINHFDLLAPFYDRLIHPPKDDRLLTVLGLPIEGRLLDVGGGTGRASQPLAALVGQTFIADESLSMLAQTRAKPALQGVACHSEMLPFPANCFQRVIMVDAFHHLEDQDRSLAELWRVLAPGGRLVIEEPDIRAFGARLIALAERLMLMRSRFVSAARLVSKFDRPGADAKTWREGHRFWVLADKPKSQSR